MSRKNKGKKRSSRGAANRRDSERFDYRGKIRFRRRGEERTFSDQALDISESGVFIETDSSFEEGADLYVEVEQNSGQVIRALAEVVRTTGTGLALRFVEMDNSSRERAGC